MKNMNTGRRRTFEQWNDIDPYEGIAEMIEKKTDPNDKDIFSFRGKLYRNGETYINAYIRILKNNDNGRCRFVARTSDGDVCIANHYILTHLNNNRVGYYWTTHDYSDTSNPKLVQFRLLTRNETQLLFKEKYDNALQENLSKFQ